MVNKYTKISHSSGEFEPGAAFSFGDDDKLRFATEFQQLLSIKDPKEIAPFMRAITGDYDRKGLFGFRRNSRTSDQGWTIINDILGSALKQVNDPRAPEPIKSGVCRIIARTLFPYAASFEKQKGQIGTIITPNAADFAKKEQEWLRQLPKIGKYLELVKESAANDAQFVQGIAVLARAMNTRNLDEPRSITENGEKPNPINSFITIADFIIENLKDTGSNCYGLQTCLFKICADMFNLDVTKDLPKLIEAYKKEQEKIDAVIQNIKRLEAAIHGQPQEMVNALEILLKKYAEEAEKESTPVKKQSLLSKMGKINAALLSQDEEVIKKVLEEEISNIAWVLEWSGKSMGKPYTIDMPIKNLDKYNAAFDFFDKLLVEKTEGSRDKLIATLPTLEENLKIRQERLTAKGGGNPEEQQITAKMANTIAQIKALSKNTKVLQSVEETLAALRKYNKSMTSQAYEATARLLVDSIKESLLDENMLFPDNELIKKIETTGIKKQLLEIGRLTTVKQVQESELTRLKNENKALAHVLESTESLFRAAKRINNLDDKNLKQSIRNWQTSISNALEACPENDSSKASEILTIQAKFLTNSIESKINLTVTNLQKISTLENDITALKGEKSKLSIWPWRDRAVKAIIQLKINAKKDGIIILKSENKQLAKKIPELLKRKEKDLKAQLHQKEMDIAAKDKEIKDTSKDIDAAQKKLHRDATQHLQELSTFVAEVRTTTVTISTPDPDVSLTAVQPTGFSAGMQTGARGRASLDMGPSRGSIELPGSPGPRSPTLIDDEPPPLPPRDGDAAIPMEVNQLIEIINQAKQAITQKQEISIVDRGIIIDTTNKTLAYLADKTKFSNLKEKLEVAYRDFSSSVSELEKATYMPDSSGYIAGILQKTEEKAATQQKDSSPRAFTTATAGGTVGFMLGGPLGAAIGAAAPLFAQVAQKLLEKRARVIKPPKLDPPKELIPPQAREPLTRGFFTTRNPTTEAPTTPQSIGPTSKAGR